jgi:hypothetical protein
MGKAILLDSTKTKNTASYKYYVDPPLANEYPDRYITNNKKSSLIGIIFNIKGRLGMVMEVLLLNEFDQVKENLSFKYYEDKMKDYDPSDMNPEPFLEAIGYNIL